MMAWAQAGRPRPCVKSSSSSCWSPPRSSEAPFVNGPGLRWAQTQLLGSLGLDDEGEIASVDLKGAVEPGNGEGPKAAKPGSEPDPDRWHRFRRSSRKRILAKRIRPRAGRVVRQATRGVRRRPRPHRLRP